MRVELNGYIFDPTYYDGDEELLNITKIDGTEAPGIQLHTSERMIDGDVISFGRLTHFALVANGYGFTPYRGGHERIKNKITGAFQATYVDHTMVVYPTGADSYSLPVRRAGDIMTTHVGPHIVEFQVPLTTAVAVKT